MTLNDIKVTRKWGSTTYTNTLTGESVTYKWGWQEWLCRILLGANV